MKNLVEIKTILYIDIKSVLKNGVKVVYVYHM